jgi:hypothetical protein
VIEAVHAQPGRIGVGDPPVEADDEHADDPRGERVVLDAQVDFDLLRSVTSAVAPTVRVGRRAAPVPSK